MTDTRDFAAAPIAKSALGSPTYAELLRVAHACLHKAAEIASAGPPAPLAAEWQGVFATARVVAGAPSEETQAIAAFGLRILMGRADLLASLGRDQRSRVQTLAATAVELTATDRPAVATALASLVAGIAGDESFTALLPFFICLEALVRCRLAADAGAPTEPPQTYWRIALDTVRTASSARLVVCGGLSGSGKSFVANGVAGHMGARLFSSDSTRKQLAGIGLTSRTPQDQNATVYNTRMTDRVYRSLVEHARDELTAGWPVILDATYLTPQRRALPVEVATECGLPAAIVWCVTDDATARQRLHSRATEGWAVSDADARVRALQRKGARQPQADESGATALNVDTGGVPAKVFADLLPRLLAALEP